MSPKEKIKSKVSVIKVKKAEVLPEMSGLIEPSRSEAELWEQAAEVVISAGALPHPYPKDMLARIALKSPALQESIRVYLLVIEGYGHTFDEVLEGDETLAFEQVKMSIWMNRIRMGQEPEESEPTDDEVQARQDSIEMQIRIQRMMADRFFDNCGRFEGKPISFVALRKLLREDKETMGESYVEVLRDAKGNIRRLQYLPSIGMYKFALTSEKVAVRSKEKVDSFVSTVTKEFRQFRKYVQADPYEQAVVFFKEIGDPRVMSAKTGKYYKTKTELYFAERRENGNEMPREATEVICDKIYSPLTPYGLPRWIANAPAIGGSRKAEEINHDYLENKGIPDFLFLCAGGQLGDEADKRIADYLRQIKQRGEFHSVLVIEAVGEGSDLLGQAPHPPKLEVKPLTDHLPEDALFLKYLEFNDTRIGAAFNVPPILRGRCHAEDTEFLTDSGWKIFDDVSPGDKLATFNCDSGYIEFEAPLSSHCYHFSGDLLHLRNRGIDALVTPNHRMWVRARTEKSRPSKPWMFVEASELHGIKGCNGGRLEVPVSAFWAGDRLNSFVIPESKRKNAWGPARGTKNKKRDLERHSRSKEKGKAYSVSMDSFLRFIGYFVSEGHTGSDNQRGVISLSQNDNEVAEKMIATVREIGIEPRIRRMGAEGRENQLEIWFSHLGLWEWLRENCGVGCSEKKLPSFVLNLCQDQLRVCLTALIEGDGHVPNLGTDGSFAYSTTSQTLNNQLHEVCLKLGIAFTSKKCDRSDKGWSTIYCGYGHHDLKHSLNPKESISHVPYDGNVVCFTVPNGTLVTKRNGRVLISGNSEDYTRATAQQAIIYFENMVAQPERLDFDEEYNSFLFPLLGMDLLKFRSLGPDTSDPLTTARVIDTLLRHGSLVPNDGRQEAEKLLGRELPHIKEEWAKKPVKLVISETVSGRTYEKVEEGLPETPEQVNQLNDPLKSALLADAASDESWAETFLGEKDKN